MKSALLCLFLEPQTSLVTRLCFVLRLSQKYLQNRHYQEKNKRGEDPKFPRKISLSYTFSSFVNPLFSIPKVSSPQTMKVTIRHSGKTKKSSLGRIESLPYPVFLVSSTSIILPFRSVAFLFLHKEKSAWLPWRCHKGFTKESLGFTFEVWITVSYLGNRKRAF